MDKLFLIIPIFGYEENIPKIMNWIHDDQTQQKFKRYDLRPQIHLLHVNAELVTGVKITDKVPKGIGIRLALEARKTDKVDYIVSIDGDGQIPFENIFELLFLLKTQPVDAIIACRSGELGISKERALIEKFELFLLGQLYGCDLPDGQCGFWGFKGELLERLYLTANGFEIELDLLTQILDSKPKIRFGFIETKVRESERTTFNVEHHRDKIVFLSKKLGIGKNLITSLATAFEKNNSLSLPIEYTNMLSSLTIEEIPIQYPICFNGTCMGCKHRIM